MAKELIGLLALLCFHGPSATSPSIFKPPIYLWPLANISLFNDVVGSHHMQHDEEDGDCYNFIDGPSGLPYSVLDLSQEVESGIDATLKGSSPLRDMTVSFYVYPDKDSDEISGTLFHYLSDDREFMRVRMLGNTFLISFRDEYGMNAGMMYLVDFLTPRAWNHVVFSRVYVTGAIIVYKDGVELYNMDDDFSNVIGFPHDGKLRLGKSQDSDDQGVFEGNFACVQVYNIVVPVNRMAELQSYCWPEAWNNEFSYYYETRNGKQCLTDPPPEIDYSLVTMTTLSRGTNWHGFLVANGLQDSGQQAGYFQVTAWDEEPTSVSNLIGSFNVTSTKLCGRLCMRVNGCVGTWASGTGLSCNLYDSEPPNFTASPGSRFYTLVV